QAIQTNSQCVASISNALAVYRQIRALDTNGFEAGILYAAYARAVGDKNASAEAIRSLLPMHPQRTQEYLERFQRVEAILQIVPEHEPSYGLPTNGCHAIVVLGAAL